MSASAHTRRNTLSGGQVAAILIAIGVATAVVPPAAAWKLNQTRVERAAFTAREIAQYLRANRDQVEGVASRAEIACGFGLVPKSPRPDDPWLKSPLALSDLYGASRPTDAWEQCYLLHIGALRSGGPVLLLSTGPNGLIDTPLESSAPVGDDVGVRVW
jgi:type II secretory pathway pseudopilin PulG